MSECQKCKGTRKIVTPFHTVVCPVCRGRKPEKKQYPPQIMRDVRQNYGLEPNDTSRDQMILEMSKDEILDRVTTWNGLIGYGDTIKRWVQDVYDIKLPD